MKRKIVLGPLSQIDCRLLEMLKEGIEHTFNCLVEIKARIGSLDYAYAPKRKQYLAPLILSTLRGFSLNADDRCLGVVDVDLYSPGSSFVFGEADIGSRVAIISLYRLRPERYGLAPDERLYQSRATKEAVHELGHTHYLSHCQETKCVMHLSNGLADTDRKAASFCQNCEQGLKEVVVNRDATTT